MENWVDLIPHNPQSLLEDLDIFKEFMVVTDRFNGFKPRIRISLGWNGGLFPTVFKRDLYGLHQC
jgi:oligopeptidase B